MSDVVSRASCASVCARAVIKTDPISAENVAMEVYHRSESLISMLVNPEEKKSVFSSSLDFVSTDKVALVDDTHFMAFLRTDANKLETGKYTVSTSWRRVSASSSFFASRSVTPATICSK